MSATVQFLNGIDTDAFRGTVSEIAADPEKGQTSWAVTTHWRGGTRSDTLVRQCSIGGEQIKRNFVIRVDEPLQLCGTNQFANPQEHLMAALNSCMMVGYVAVCAMEGIEVENIRIELTGDIDLRGFFALEPGVKPGYDSLKYDVYIKGNGTPEQFQRVHEIVSATSPNRFNIAHAISLVSQLHVV